MVIYRSHDLIFNNENHIILVLMSFLGKFCEFQHLQCLDVGILYGSLVGGHFSHFGGYNRVNKLNAS